MCNRKKNYRDLGRYQKTRANQKTAGYPRRNWTSEEDTIVLAHEQTDTKLSHQLRRSVASIQKRRWLLNQNG